MSSISISKYSLFTALILSISPDLISDDLGLLLTTPEERTLIRQWHNQKETPVTVHTPIPEKSTVSVSSVHYNGMVIDSRGKTSYWVNGRRVETPEEAEQLGVSFTPDLKQGLRINPANQRDKQVFIQPGEAHNRQEIQPPVALPFMFNTESEKTPAHNDSDIKN